MIAAQTVSRSKVHRSHLRVKNKRAESVDSSVEKCISEVPVVCMRCFLTYQTENFGRASCGDAPNISTQQIITGNKAVTWD